MRNVTQRSVLGRCVTRTENKKNIKERHAHHITKAIEHDAKIANSSKTPSAPGNDLFSEECV